MTGAKAKLAPYIISQIPPHRVFVELFAGTAAVTRAMRRSERTILVEPDAATIAWHLADLRGPELLSVLVQANLVSIAGHLRGTAQPKLAVLEADAFDFLDAYDPEPNWFIYADPPYHPATLKSPQRYRHKFGDEQHRELLRRLKAMNCPVAISGYRHKLYDRELKGWRRLDLVVHDRSHEPRTECVWMNYPEPAWLHDPSHVGTDNDDRWTRSKKRKRFSERVAAVDRPELQCMLEAIADRFAEEGGEIQWRYGTVQAGQPGCAAESGGGARVAGKLLAPPGKAALDRDKARQVLSLFPGIGLLDRAFCEGGVEVTPGPDTIFGQDIADFSGREGRFDGIIGGPPCQDFSSLNRDKNRRPRHEILDSYGAEMLRHFLRFVSECKPTWFLIENVPAVPDVEIDGYQVQRFGLTDLECGGVQRRNRHFQFGHVAGWIMRPERVTELAEAEPTALASDGRRSTRSFAEHCRLQGLDGPLDLPGWSKSAKFAAVGNGVPLAMGRVLARSVTAAGPRDVAADCVCGCGRRITPPARHATVTCRKVMERQRAGERPVVRA